MKMIDLHCDTILEILKSGERQRLRENNLHVDIQKLKRAEAYAQFFALFVDSREVISQGGDLWVSFVELYDLFAKEMRENKGDICLATNEKELVHNAKEGKISAFLTVEDAGFLENKHERLDRAYDMGVRLMTLTWNYPNCIGCPNGEFYKHLGLTPFGKEVIQRMNEKGMIIDVSHLSDKGFYDVAELSKQPFVASHSNARAVHRHGRNLTDDMLKMIGERGGVVGLNYCPLFLNDIPESNIASIIAHAKHIIDVAGTEAIALGSDFDGIGGKMEMNHIGEVDKLFDGFIQAGFTMDLIEKIAYKNTERIIKEVLK